MNTMNTIKKLITWLPDLLRKIPDEVLSIQYFLSYNPDNGERGSLKRHARDFFYWTFIQQIVDCFASSSRNRGKISDSVYFWSFSHQFNLPTIFNQIMRAESYMACVMSQEMTTFSGHSLSWSLSIAWYWSSVQWRSYESLCKLIVRKWKYLSFPVPPIEHTVTQLQRATFPWYTRSPWSFQFLHDKPVNLDDNSTNMNQTLISGTKIHLLITSQKGT